MIGTYKDLVFYNHRKWEFTNYFLSRITTQSLKSVQHEIIKKRFYCDLTFIFICQYLPRGNISSTTFPSSELGDPSHWSSSSPSISNCTSNGIFKPSQFQSWITSMEGSFIEDELGTQWKHKRTTVGLIPIPLVNGYVDSLKINLKHSPFNKIFFDELWLEI